MTTGSGKADKTKGESRTIIADIGSYDKRNQLYIPQTFGNDPVANPPILRCNTTNQTRVYRLTEDQANQFSEILQRDTISTAGPLKSGDTATDVKDDEFMVFTKEAGKPYQHQIRKINPNYISPFYPGEKESGKRSPLEHVCEWVRKELKLPSLRVDPNPKAIEIPPHIDPDTVGSTGKPTKER